MRLLITASLALALAAPPTLAQEGDTLSGRVQTIFDPTTREVTRLMVRLRDPHPEMGLEFRWTPAPGNWPGVTPSGAATGPGTVTWRLPGTARYDPRAVHHRYTGMLRDGVFDGQGRLDYRDGAMAEGTWKNGRLHGPGMRRDAAGNRYEGPFVDGEPQGVGIWRDRAGWTYTGGFVAGLRDGAGEVQLPGGARYDVVMRTGVEVSNTRPATLADPTLGGLHPAQTAGSQAAKVGITVAVDQRISFDQSVPYTSVADGGNVYIFTQEDDLIKMWDGSGRAEIAATAHMMTPEDWADTRAFLQIDLATVDGSRVRLQDFALAVDYSVPHLRPALDVTSHVGCVGFRPSFDIQNHGWGAVENARARVRFANPDDNDYVTPAAGRRGTGWYDLPIGSFDAGIDVDIRPVLAAAGVDARTLETQKFTCPSVGMLPTCTRRILSTVNFGALNGFVSGAARTLETDLVGEITFDWTDAAGTKATVTEDFGARISLAYIQSMGTLAECGAGGAFATAAPEYLDVKLPVEGTGYRIDIPVRGNPNLASLTSRVKLWAERSSFHSFRAEARFTDGSVRTSPPLLLYFLNPRQPDFITRTTPAVCTIDPEEDTSC